MVRLVIERLAYGGDAIAHLEDGRTAFVAGGVPGDTVEAEISADKGRFVNAALCEVIEASPDRVAPPCPYFGACGGCSWQHVSAEAQLRAKRDAVTDALKRIGGIANAEDLVAEAVPSRNDYGYRNKIELVVDPASSRPVLGFHRAGTDAVIPVENCMLLPKKLRRAPRALSGALRYLAGESDLGLVRVGLRTAANTKDTEIALWTSPGAFPRAAAAKTLGQAVTATSIVRVLTKGPSRERRIAGVEVLAGKGFWRERLAGIDFALSAPSFFQVNTPGAETLVGLVLDYLAPDGTDRVLDLYSGAGTFTLPLAQTAGEVVAVEASGPAVRDLRRNLESAQLWAEVVGGDAAREVGSAGRCDLAVVDPPRSGLDPAVIEGLANEVRPGVIAYVSCDPATLARDTARLQESGYTLTAATPVDLFPQTYHVETVARFERTKK
jgi:23S rRNA (uracil1939-C5)-methyltransferase